MYNTLSDWILYVVTDRLICTENQYIRVRISDNFSVVIHPMKGDWLH